ncbi:MAG: hypothetical protein IPM47_03335 [Sphingobacteriales bacterium]|nr:MAG: hypothetical protein IPM47_03335 [Sphingobacteriales bacterium]
MKSKLHNSISCFSFKHLFGIFTFSLLLLLGRQSSLFAQQETYSRFIISDARINDYDYTERYVGSGGYIVFYEVDGELFMANVLEDENTQSYGRLFSMNIREIKETYENYEAEVYTFKWSYINDYDTKRGTASVRLTKVYKPVGVAFICVIVPENLDVLEYRGYMEGSIDFSGY